MTLEITVRVGGKGCGFRNGKRHSIFHMNPSSIVDYIVSLQTANNMLVIAAENIAEKDCKQTYLLK